MNTDIIDALSANLALPINQSVQTANGAQFALMLSLMLEGQVGRAKGVDGVRQIVEGGAGGEIVSSPLQLNRSLGLALQSGNAAAFNLLNSLYSERIVAVDEPPPPRAEQSGYPSALDRRGKGESMLSQIEQSRQQAQRLSA